MSGSGHQFHSSNGYGQFPILALQTILLAVSKYANVQASSSEIIL